MPVDDKVTDVSLAELQTVLEDLDFEGYELVEKVQQADGLFTLHVRKNSATGVEQSATEGNAVVAPSDVPAAGTGTTTPPTPAPGTPQKLGPDGAKLIQSFESCARRIGGGKFQAYRDAVGVLTIGWGHTNHLGRQFGPGAVWTQQECDDAFLEDMRHFEGAVHKLVKVPLNQSQFDALVSFCYNCGDGNLRKSTLLKKVNSKDFAGAAQEFKKWVKAKGVTLKGLVRRRASESLMFQGIPDANYDGVPD
jgi:lysozyme